MKASFFFGKESKSLLFLKKKKQKDFIYSRRPYTQQLVFLHVFFQAAALAAADGQFRYHAMQRA